MVALGLVLLVLCVVLGTGIALSNTDEVNAEAFGVTLSNVSLGGVFTAGVVVGAVTMLGLGLMLVGAARKRARKRATKREVQHVRTEQDSLTEENARLQAELKERPAAPARPSGPRTGDDVEEQGKHRR